MLLTDSDALFFYKILPDTRNHNRVFFGSDTDVLSVKVTKLNVLNFKKNDRISQ